MSTTYTLGLEHLWIVHYTRLGSSIKQANPNKLNTQCHANWPVMIAKFGVNDMSFNTNLAKKSWIQYQRPGPSPNLLHCIPALKTNEYTCSSSQGLKSFLMLKVFLISSGVFPSIMFVTVVHVTSRRPYNNLQLTNLHKSAQSELKLEILFKRREILCLKFAKKSLELLQTGCWV